MNPATFAGAFTLTAETAVTQYRLVKLGTSEDEGAHAGAGDAVIGVANASAAADAEFSVQPLNTGGVVQCTADGAISFGAKVYAGASGYVSATAIGDVVGVALGAATTQGDRIAVCPSFAGNTSLLSNYTVKDDFDNYTDGARWTKVASASGTASAVDERNGVIDLVASDSTAGDNDITILATTTEPFKVEASKSIIGYWRVQLTEANDDDANLCVGFSSVVTSSLLGNDGAGPPGTYDGALAFKVDGGSVWQGETSAATSQNTDTNIGAFTDGEWTDIVIEILTDSSSDTAATVNFYVNGTLGGTESLTISGLEEMHLVAGAVKNGGTNAETLKIDYCFASQVR